MPMNQSLFDRLQSLEGLKAFDRAFVQLIEAHDGMLADQLASYRAGVVWSESELSVFLLRLAPWIERHLSEAWGIESEVGAKFAALLSHDPIMAFKSWYVKKEAKKRSRDQDQLPDFEALHAWLVSALPADASQDLELAVARLGLDALARDDRDLQERLVAWCVRAHDQDRVKNWVSFHLPKRKDPERLVACQAETEAVWRAQTTVVRDGFDCTRVSMGERAIQDQVHYCVYCHEKNQGDFCSRGFPVKKQDPSQGFKVDDHGVTLTGCPLDERISEMHCLRRDGYTIAALAMIMRDNPLCPATGHRICNDCMKACIYQKQDPVDIPQIETATLMDVLSLPFGVELVDVLMRWNPLRSEQWLPADPSSRRALVVGMGPAGFTLAHHLWMEGHVVVGVDGLTIRPLPEAWLNQPVAHWETLQERLSQRQVWGFGGVAEYGITVRWDKNFLQLIYLMLARRERLAIHGGMRLGGAITLPDAWALGFHHVAVAVGAGLPHELNIPNSLAPGMRQASDFLMALHLSGASHPERLTALHVRLPAVVIGGGLTGVDAATELQAYYLVQVRKVAALYKRLVATLGEHTVRQSLSEAQAEQLDEQLAHSHALQGLDALDAMARVRAWGGVAIVYRRRMQDSPAYRLNHEELEKALEEGVVYREKRAPVAVELDANGWVQTLVCEVMERQGDGWSSSGVQERLPARTILVATGAKPNIAYAYEHRDLARQGMHYALFQDQEGVLEPGAPGPHCKADTLAPFASWDDHGQRVSVLGDTHPQFHGSVVKAMASAKRIYPEIHRVMMRLQPSAGEDALFLENLAAQFAVRLVSVVTVCSGVKRWRLHAPLLASRHQPGQFYRIQGPKSHEAAALIARVAPDDPACLECWVRREASAAEQALWGCQEGASLAVMGPTGERASLSENQVWMVDDSAWTRVLALAPVAAARGRVRIWVTLTPGAVLFDWDTIQGLAEVVVFVAAEDLDSAQLSLPGAEVRVGDALDHLTRALLGTDREGCQGVAWWGRAGWLRAFYGRWQSWAAREGFLQPTTVLVQGPMQCMLKGVCAQCLQWQVDPKTGQRIKAVFACSWQAQPGERVDMEHLCQRQALHGPQEVLAKLALASGEG